MTANRFMQAGVRVILMLAAATGGGMMPATHIASAYETHNSNVHDKLSKTVYLTFDDGPSQRYTPLILDALQREQIHATFFVLGERCRQFPQIVRRMRMDGHQIGSHGYDHKFITHQTVSEVRQEVMKADAEIVQACGAKPVYYRPPGGLMNDEERIVIRRLGHPIAMWTVDSLDWKTPSAETILETVERQVRPGSIILFHDGVSNSKFTLAALPALISDLRAQGYQFATLPS